MKKYAANLITGSRVLLAIAILWIPVFSIPFYVLYLLCGITDMLDGIIARRTGTASSLGSKLDSMADVVFVMVCLIKILPSLQLEWLAGVWIAAIAFLRMVNIIFGYVYRHQLILLHTIANKVTGFLLFLLPLCMQIIDIHDAPSVFPDRLQPEGNLFPALLTLQPGRL